MTGPPIPGPSRVPATRPAGIGVRAGFAVAVVAVTVGLGQAASAAFTFGSDDRDTNQ